MIYQIISRIQNIWAQHKVVVIINVIVIGGLLFFVLPTVLPKPPLDVKTPNLQGMDQTVGGVEVTTAFPDPSVPAQLKLYRLDENFKQDEAVFADIAARLKINKTLTNTVRTNDAGEALSLDITQHRIVYSKDLTPQFAGDEPESVDMTPLNMETAKQQTEQWLQSIGFTDIEANTLDTRYYIRTDAYEGLTETEPSKANVVRFTFSRKLDGLEVTLGASTAEPAYVTVDNTGVIQADFSSFVATFTPDRERQLMPLSGVIENVKAGKYTFAQTIAAVAEDSNDTKPVKFQLTTARLLYRVDSTQRAAIPYWNFTGTATLRNEQVVPLEITSPAVTL